MTDAGWFDDPSGRFGKRWFDGTKWSDHVVLANGTASTDALPESDAPFPPPAAAPLPQPPPPGYGPPPAAYGSTPPVGYGSTPPVGYGSTPPQGPFPSQPGFGPPPGAPYGPGLGGPRDRYAPGAGLAVSGVGLILVLLSVFVLKWVDADKGGFLDIASGIRDRDTSNVEGFGQNVAVQYFVWAGFVLFGLTLVLAVLAGIPVPTNSTGNSLWRIIGAVFAGLAAIGHTVTLLQLTKGEPTPEIGAWLGTVGYFVVIVGLVLGARRVRPRAQPYAAPPFAGAPR